MKERIALPVYWQSMLDKAKAAFSRAYCPYSKFQVGCCIQTKAGQLFEGANVESASFPVSHCAEVSAVANMVSQAGAQPIATVLVYANSIEACFPCGRCRQLLLEFSNEETIVYVASPEGLLACHRLYELVPHRFSSHTLHHTH